MKISKDIKCWKCKEFKPLSGFYKSTYEKNGHTRICKQCSAIVNRTAQLRFSRRLYRYRKSAKDRNLEFTLSKEDFLGLWGKNCFYCNEIIGTIGIDRKDNKLGYTKENIVPCCKICNYMKRKLSYKDFIEQCRRISDNE